MKKNFKKVFSLVFSLIMLISFTACGGPTPEELVTSALDALKSGDESFFEGSIESFEESFDSSSAEDLDKALKTVLSTMDYEVISTTEDGNKATVKVKITNKDYSKAVEKYFSDVMAYAMSNLDASEDEVDKKVVELLVNAINESAEGESTVTNEADITLTKGDDGWVLDDPSDELMNALFGNMVDGMNNLSSSFY